MNPENSESPAPHPLYPLLFEPIFQYRLWGGRRLENLLSEPLPGDDPIGEAWILSDRDDFSNPVMVGEFQGRTLSELMREFPRELLGDWADVYPRFPLLLKFLDAREMLSVQVHPSDDQLDLLPAGERGKTEAWVVLEADSESTIYAGLNPGTTPEELRTSIASGTLESLVAGFHPKVGDGIFIPSGTVHALGGGVMVFEVQENSDVTFRLYDWGRVDAKTHLPRALHIDQGLAAIDFYQGAVGPVTPTVESSHRERLFDCEHFVTWRLKSSEPLAVGKEGEPRVLVCLEGSAQIVHAESSYHLRQGDVMLLPAVVGECQCQPDSELTVLEIALPKPA